MTLYLRICAMLLLRQTSRSKKREHEQSIAVHDVCGRCVLELRAHHNEQGTGLSGSARRDLPDPQVELRDGGEQRAHLCVWSHDDAGGRASSVRVHVGAEELRGGVGPPDGELHASRGEGELTTMITKEFQLFGHTFRVEYRPRVFMNASDAVFFEHEPKAGDGVK